jgi:hypothetical protein
MKHFALAVVLALATVGALAQDAPTLKQLETMEQREKKLDDMLKELKSNFESAMRRRASDCARAIGYAPFCSCILKDLPVAWTFSDYVAITTRTKEENGYEKLDAQGRAAYDKVAAIRDSCVRMINSKPKA